MASKYPIHKNFAFIPSINQRFSRVPVAATNALIRLSRIILPTARPGVDVLDRQIPGRIHPIKLKIFQPTANPENKKRPCLVYFHGVLCADLCRSPSYYRCGICRQAGCRSRFCGVYIDQPGHVSCRI